MNLPQVCKSISYLTIPHEIIELQRMEKPFYWQEVNDGMWSCNFIDDFIFKIKWLIRKNKTSAFNPALLVSLSTNEDICLDKLLKAAKFLTQLGPRMTNTCNVCNDNLDIVIQEFDVANEVPSIIFDENGIFIFCFFNCDINHYYLFYLDPSDLRRKVQESRKNLFDIYSEFMRTRCNDFGEVEGPADLCRVNCVTCGFKAYIWVHFCQGINNECKSSSTVARLVIGSCKSCGDALTECRKCTRACQQCKGDLCLQCSCGEFCRTIGRTLCSSCAGNKYDHLLSKYQRSDY